MAINKIEIQSANGDIYYPHTSADVVKYNNNILNSEVKTITFNKEIIEPTSDKYVMIWDKICTEKVNEAYNEFFEKFE